MGQSVDYSNHGTAEEICEAASKLITFIDLAGHQVSRSGSWSSSNLSPPEVPAHDNLCPDGLPATLRDAGRCRQCRSGGHDAGAPWDSRGSAGEAPWPGVLRSPQVPFFVVVTKVDTVPEERLNHTLNSLAALLKSAGANKVTP